MKNGIKSNLGISMVESYSVLFQQKQIEALAQFDNNFFPRLHIYMILKTKRTYFDINSIRVANTKITGNIFMQEQEQFEKIPFLVENSSRSRDLEVKANYNKDEIMITTPDNINVLTANAFMLLLDSGFTIDCEVLYIGQSFGKSGSRSAFDRLLKHETLQKIYSEKEYDKDVYLSGWNFDRNSIAYIPPQDIAGLGTVGMRHLALTMDPYNQISKKQEIDFTEAALIRYFQPKYNNEFKYTFPSKDHSVYSDCYKVGLDYIQVEINTKRLNFRLFSEDMDPSYDHTPFFDLKGKRSKENLFGIK